METSLTAKSHDLANQINEAHQDCLRATGQAIDHAMRCGDLLTQAKEKCEHGTWERWLTDNFSGSVRTAQVYMRLANNREKLELKAQSSALLSVDSALRMLASPKQSEPSAIEQAEERLGIEYDPDLIPPPDCALIYKRQFTDCTKFLIIEPSAYDRALTPHPDEGCDAEEYYFVSAVTMGADSEHDSFCVGTKRPIIGKCIRFAIEGLDSLDLLEHGQRIESDHCERLTYNRFLFDSFEGYVNRQKAEWQRLADSK